MFWEVAQLISLVIVMPYLLYGESGNNDGIYADLLDIGKGLLLIFSSSGGTEAVNVIFLILAIGWLITVSLPLVCEQLLEMRSAGKGTFTQSSMWIKCQWVFCRILFVFLVIGWVRLLLCETNDENCVLIMSSARNIHYTSESSLVFILFIFFLLTASIVTVYNTAQVVFLKDFNIDITYPIVFVHILQWFETLFIVSATFVMYHDKNVGLMLCMVLSYLMLVWHLMYPSLSKKIVQHASPGIDGIYGFVTIPHLKVLRVFVYIVLCYATTVVYLNIGNGVKFGGNFGAVLLIGMASIFGVGIIVSFIYHKKCLFEERRRLLESTNVLGKVIDLLNDAYGKQDAYGFVEKAASNNAIRSLKKIASSDYNELSTRELFTPFDVAILLVQFERFIPYQRLNDSFLRQRRKWIQNLLLIEDESDFSLLLPFVKFLNSNMKLPSFFTLGLNILKYETMFKNAPIEICCLLMEFVQDYQNIGELCKVHLTNIDRVPSTVDAIDSWGKYFKVSNSVKRFGNIIDGKVDIFINKTLMWHVRKEECIYHSYLYDMNYFNTYSNYDAARNNIRSKKLYYYVLHNDFLFYFDREIDFKSLGSTPNGYIDMATIKLVIKNGLQTEYVPDYYDWTSSSNNNQWSVMNNESKENDSKENDEAENGKKKVDKNQRLYRLELNQMTQDDISWRKRWYYWWNRAGQKSTTLYFGSEERGTYENWYGHLQKIVDDREKRDVEQGNEWLASVTTQMNNTNESDNKENKDNENENDNESKKQDGQKDDFWNNTDGLFMD